MKQTQMQCAVAWSLAFVTLFSGQAAGQDRVHRKNSRTVSSTVIEPVSKKQIKVKTQEEEVLSINSSAQSQRQQGTRPEKQSSSRIPQIDRMQPQNSNRSLSGNFGIRGSIGTDMELGIGYGVGASYIWRLSTGGTAFELGADVFSHTSSGSEKEDNQLGETTDWNLSMLIFGVRGNVLLNYSPRETGVYFIGGFGVVVASLDYRERTFATNVIPGFGYAPSSDRFDEVAAGNLVNVGVGMTFGSGLEVRLETPMLFFYGTGSDRAAFAPTATLGVQYRF